ncbi:MAG: YraN family protein [Bacteroidota bacterium]
MARHHELGKIGEVLARRFLEGKGYKIAESNWRHGRAEIDLICWDGNVLVFVEVKTRSSKLFGHPAAAVTARKEAILIGAAGAYMEQIGHEWEFRFDIISVNRPESLSPEIEHFPDAFYH